MKTTTTIHDIVRSELMKSGKSEFFDNEGNFVFYNDDFQFIKKMLRYDDDIHEIVTNTIYQGFTFDNSEVDRMIKKMFMARFLNREIGRQTLEAFSMELIYISLSSENYITNIFTRLEKFLTSEIESSSKTDGNDQSDTRTLFSSLPQNNVNLNVDDTILDYGDNNNIARSKNIRGGTSTNNQKSYNLENLLMTDGLIENYFLKIDKKCFLQTW